MYNKKIILDFDGTIFRLFINYDLDKVKNELIILFRKNGILFTKDNDVFDSFFIVNDSIIDNDLKSKTLMEINNIIIKAEKEALNSGVIVDGFLDFLRFAKNNNIEVGIVSNNSKDCIIDFFKKYSIKDNITIIGRDALNPTHMKPNTFMLNQICEILKCNKNNLVFVGDTLNDYRCAKDFGVEFYAMTITKLKKVNFISLNENVKTFNNFYDLIAFLS